VPLKRHPDTNAAIATKEKQVLRFAQDDKFVKAGGTPALHVRMTSF